MGNNTQSRKWALVINNPHESGLDHSAITKLLMRFSPTYFCMADEIATTGTYHTHVFLYSKSPMRFSTLKNRFPTAHIEKSYGSARENRDYIRKEGKWAETEKADTSVPGTFEEQGDLPAEKEENDPRDICHITNYGGRNGVRFDAYHCQSILVFEEFHSQIPIADMLNYLDIYPLTLPARYSDRQACYTKVYITCNLPPEALYQDVQRWQWEIWKAFQRRIINVIEYLPDGTTVQHKKGGWPP